MLCGAICNWSISVNVCRGKIGLSIVSFSMFRQLVKVCVSFFDVQIVS